MNVEEGMKLLKDPTVWNVELTPRGGVFAKPRLVTWQFATVGIAAAVVVAVVASSVVLFGNAQPAAPLGGPPTSQTPAPSSTPPTPPEPTSTPSTDPTGLKAPAAIFNGDCTEFISDSDMSEIARTPIRASTSPDYDEDGVRDPESSVYQQLGVLTCEWQTDEGSIQLILLRDEVAPGGKRKTCDSYTWGEAAMNEDLCVVDAESHGIRMSGSVDWGSSKKSKATASRLIEYFESHIFDNAVDSLTGPVRGSWPTQIVCADLSPISVGDRRASVTLDILGSDAGSLPVEDQIASLYSNSGCLGEMDTADGGTVRFSFRAFSGGAWQFDKALDDLESRSQSYGAPALTGFDRAILAVDGERRDYYLVSDSNFLQVTVYDKFDDERLITAIVDMLD